MLFNLKNNLFLFGLLSFFLMACGEKNSTNQEQGQTAEATKKSDADLGYTNLDVAGFKSKMQEEDVVVLDVRTPKETAEGLIPGAVEIDIYESGFEEKIKALDDSKTYLVYCRSGGRSVDACLKMKEWGFDDLYNLRGGYTAWEKDSENKSNAK